MMEVYKCGTKEVTIQQNNRGGWVCYDFPVAICGNKKTVARKLRSMGYKKKPERGY